MKPDNGYMKYFVIGFFALAIIALGWSTYSQGGNHMTGNRMNMPAPQSPTHITLPQFSKTAMVGQQFFNANCAACHGKNATGTDQGPPLLNNIYNPGHHPDAAFFNAAKYGVQQHHWPFGNMPPQPQVSEDQVALIVKYIRELQVANGITYREHRM
jgi:mono/diheme cytochrome c family protein